MATMMMIRMMAVTMFTGPGMLRPRVRKPYTTATPMKMIEIIAVCSLARFDAAAAVALTANVLATMEANAATTSSNVRYAKMQNSFFAVLSMFSATTTASVWPLWRSDANKLPKSCIAPKKMPPMSTHKSTGTQPNTAAWMGPLMGPAPAMDEKWWPSTT